VTVSRSTSHGLQAAGRTSSSSISCGMHHDAVTDCASASKLTPGPLSRQDALAGHAASRYVACRRPSTAENLTRQRARARPDVRRLVLHESGGWTSPHARLMPVTVLEAAHHPVRCRIRLRIARRTAPMLSRSNTSSVRRRHALRHQRAGQAAARIARHGVPGKACCLRRRARARGGRHQRIIAG
jgi:hypothetical protein